MARRKFSQVEAWNLWHKANRLLREEDRRRNAWIQDWPMGTHIGHAQFSADSALIGSIRTSRKLKHAVVVTADENGNLNFIAMPLVGGSDADRKE